MWGYNFKGFQQELEAIESKHFHTVRRESNTTYQDEFALSELTDLHPKLQEQVLQGWSRSFYNPEKHMEAILAYGTEDIPISRLNRSIYNKCIDTVRTRLHSLPRVRAINVLSELDSVPYTSSSAAGYDYTGEKGPFRGENHKRAMKRAKRVMWSVKEQDNPNDGLNQVIITSVPDVGFTRTQLTNLAEKTKIRNVWGRSFHYILIEGTSAAPLMQAFKTNKTFYHVGRDPLDSVPEALSEVNKDTKWIYAIDWKQFDATVSRFEIQTAFNLIKELIDFPNFETECCFEISRQLFIHKKIAAPDHRVYWSHKGIPSGSYYTSIIGSIVNRLRIEYIWRIITGHGPKHCFTQGDDSLCSDDILITPDQFAQVANPIGWMFNPEKTEYSTVPEEVSFLGRTFIGGLNTRELKRCLRLLIYPEYPVESGSISAYRAQSIAEDAGNMSQLLNQIAHRLKRRYGTASEEEVPIYFKRYIM